MNFIPISQPSIIQIEIIRKVNKISRVFLKGNKL